MGTVPESYYDFVMKYAPYFYVIATALALDAAQGQKNVTVTDGSKFLAGYPVQVLDDTHSEWNEVDSVAGDVVTMKNNLACTYYVSKNGKVEGPDPAYGRGVLAAAFAAGFLYEAHSAAQFAANQTEIRNKIVALADWILTQQCTDPAKKAYGGFKSSEVSTEYWSIDAGRCIPALLKAYALTSTLGYLDAAKLAGYTFLYNMQHQPELLGVHDTYYGGFARSVTIGDVWAQQMDIENLHCFIGLRMLAETYDVANASRYEIMMTDAAGFLKSGFEDLYLWFDPKPTGDGKWHRVGLDENQVYDDPFSFALLGLFTYESWSESVRKVYHFLQSVRPSAEYPAYNGAVCWPGYIDVVDRAPACTYYDAVTTGVLWKLRAHRDKMSLQFSYQVASRYADEFMYWGPLFTDYSPVTPQKAMANVSWLSLFFLNYQEPMTPLVRTLRKYGEPVQLFSIVQAAETVSYAEPLEVLVSANPARIEETILEPGYVINDFLSIWTLAPIRHHDKVRRKGVDYEVLDVQDYDFQGETVHRKAVLRRILGA